MELYDESPVSFAMLACQRSGTHMLREILNSSPHVAIVAEALLFNSGPGTWHDFLAALPPERRWAETPADADTRFDEYIQYVRAHVQTDPVPYYGGPKQSPTAIGLDVKYNQLKSVEPLFMNLCARPVLLDYFRQRGFRIIHLVRRNLLHQGISLLISNLCKVWRNYDKKALPGKYSISPNELLGYMYWARTEREEFTRLAKDLQPHVCYYEDVVEDIQGIDDQGVFPQNTRALAPLAEFLQVPNQFHYNDCLPKVLNRPYAEFIENYDEVVSAIQNSEYADLASTI